MAESSHEIQGISRHICGAIVVYLVNIHADPPLHRSPDEVSAELWAAVRSGHRVEHIYTRPPVADAAVLFLAQPTLADAEHAADDVLSRCAARFVRGSTVPLTMLVELLSHESNHG
ncbi:hypothetical protein [Streptomyces sp. NPDC014734]|uniref:hypothetical protein n=1 Tax=Streptomyces sp. NPDC014734 TaxID=3364886 RepID=UPI0036FCEA06